MEEKTWTWNFIPVVRILFFAIPGPKTPHSRFGAGREVSLSARVWRKIFNYKSVLNNSENIKFLTQFGLLKDKFN